MSFPVLLRSPFYCPSFLPPSLRSPFNCPSLSVPTISIIFLLSRPELPCICQGCNNFSIKNETHFIHYSPTPLCTFNRTFITLFPCSLFPLHHLSHLSALLFLTHFILLTRPPLPPLHCSPFIIFRIYQHYFSLLLFFLLTGPPLPPLHCSPFIILRTHPRSISWLYNFFTSLSFASLSKLSRLHGT